jgi:hypothetical protein
MKVYSYNGTGFWSVEEVLRRYAEYARVFGITQPRDRTPLTTLDGDIERIYPVMDRVIEGIEAGDLGCAELGVEFIQTSDSFPFGMTIKSNVARALRRTTLTEAQKERIRRRVVEMLEAAYLPREFRQYAKLARKLGLSEFLQRIKQLAALSSNARVQRYCKYFEENSLSA